MMEFAVGIQNMIRHVADDVTGDPAANGHHDTFGFHTIGFALFVISHIDIFCTVGGALMMNINDR